MRVRTTASPSSCDALWQTTVMPRTANCSAIAFYAYFDCLIPHSHHPSPWREDLEKHRWFSVPLYRYLNLWDSSPLSSLSCIWSSRAPVMSWIASRSRSGNSCSNSKAIVEHRRVGGVVLPTVAHSAFVTLGPQGKFCLAQNSHLSDSIG